MVVGLSQLPYHERPQRLGTLSMERRMLRGDLIEVFRMFNGNTRVNPWDFFEPLPEGMERRRHTWASYKPRANTKSRRCFFALRVINAWNALSMKVVYAHSGDVFKVRLDKE